MLARVVETNGFILRAFKLRFMYTYLDSFS